MRRTGSYGCWSDGAIAAALDTSINNVARTRQQLVEEGFEATLTRKYNPLLRPAADFRRRGGGETDRSGLLLAPEGFARWSLRRSKRKSSN